MNTWVPTVFKNNGGLSSSWVGARRSLGRSPASSGVGRLAGGARPFAPVHWSWLHSRETVHTVSLCCLSASSASFPSYRRYLVARGSWRLAPSCSSIASDALLWRRTPSTAPTRDHQSHSWSLLHFSQRHLKTTHCLVAEFERQFMVHPCVFTGSGVSTTPDVCGRELHGLQLYRDSI